MTEPMSTAMSRQLGHEMRSRREANGVKSADLAGILNWSVSKLSRVERGLASINEVELTHYLAHAGVSLPDTMQIVLWVRSASDGYWLSPNGPLYLEDSVRSLIFHETTATSSTIYEPLLVHGLLQTQGYARARIRREAWRTPENIELCVAARMGRQAVLDRPDPAAYTFFLHEQALRLPVGGTQTMHEQLLKLTLLAQLSHVTIRVVPTAAGEQGAFGGSFTLLQYAAARPVAYLDGHVATLFLQEEEYVDPYRLLVPDIARVALDAGQSAEFLASLASDYDRVKDGANARDLEEK